MAQIGAGVTLGPGIAITAPPVYGSYVFNTTAWMDVLGTTTDWDLGTTWTIEWWSNAANTSAPSNLYTVMCQTPGNNQIDVFYQNGRLIVNNGTDLCAEPTPGVWTHVAISQLSGVLKVFYNGVQVGTSANYNLQNLTDYVTVGRRGNNNFQYFNGELAGMRVNNTAVYTSDFNCYTPAVLYPQNIPGTVLLLKGLQTNPYVDSSNSAHSIAPTDMSWSSNYPS